ncbi:beta-lactamase family protein [Candidatus Dojkabacteria bacterium]|nr:beta-lactamase family protein [Candidatus Dojkabacteria bacterium]
MKTNLIPNPWENNIAVFMDVIMKYCSLYVVCNSFLPYNRGMEGLYDINNILSKEEFISTLNLYLKDWYVKNFAPGARTLITQGDVVLVDSRYGEMSVEEKTLRLGSISKVLLTYVLLLLVRENRINLEAKVSEYLPEFKNCPVGSIRLFKLANHTSGLRREGPWGATSNNEYPDDKELMNYFLNVSDLRDCDWGYSNIGFELLRLILEKVTSQKYTDFINDCIPKLLGGKEFEFNLPIGIYDGYTNFNYENRRRDKVKFEDYKGMVGSVGWQAEIKDVEKLLKIYIKKWGKIISKDKYFVNRHPEPNWELGISSWDFNGLKIYDHQGEVWGYTSKATYVPELDISITTFINCSAIPIHQLHTSLISALFLFHGLQNRLEVGKIVKYKSRILNLIAIIQRERVIFLRENLTSFFSNPIIAESVNKGKYKVVFGAKTSFYGEEVTFSTDYSGCEIGPYHFERADM